MDDTDDTAPLIAWPAAKDHVHEACTVSLDSLPLRPLEASEAEIRVAVTDREPLAAGSL